MVNFIVDGKPYANIDEAAKAIGNGISSNDIINALVVCGTDLSNINGHEVNVALD